MLGFLHKADQYDILYKPVHAGNKGQREVAFYEGLFSLPEEELSRDLQRLKKLIPGYYGICDITDRAGETCILFTGVCMCMFTIALFYGQIIGYEMISKIYPKHEF